MSARACTLALVILLFSSAAFGEDEVLDALALADRSPEPVERRGDLRFFVEAALAQAEYGSGAGRRSGQRLSADVFYETRFAREFRFTFSDRLDRRWQDGTDQQDTINTLREMFVTWQLGEQGMVDAGRVNVRHGVAKGFNPTDYFRDGALRSVVSPDPNGLRENRQGSVIVRGQTLWSGGSLSVLYSPKLGERPHAGSFDPDFGATNHRGRWLLAASQRIGDDFTPQFLLHGGDGFKPQLGINATTLIGDATVAYVEWSGGRSPSLLSQAVGGPDDTAFRSRLATGFTYTTPSKLSLTLEYLYSGAGMDASAWKALPRDPVRYSAHREFAVAQQDMVTKRAWFAYATVQDLLFHHLDLTAMLRFNAADDSRMAWVELRRHYRRTEIALRCQANVGGPGSEFGALPQRQSLQLLATWFY